MQRYIALMIFLLLLMDSLSAQNVGRRPSRYGFDIYVKPRVYFDSYLQYSAGTLNPMLRIRLKIQYDVLQFTRVDDSYQALYDVTLLLKESASTVAKFTTGWHGSVTESDFNKTNSMHLFQCDDKIFELPLQPGAYMIYVEVTDRATRNVFIESRKIDILETGGGKTTFSDIKFVTPQDSLSAEIHIKNEPPILEFDQSALVSFNVYSDQEDSLKVQSRLKEQRDGESILISEHSQTLYHDSMVSAYYEPLDKNKLKEGHYLFQVDIRTGKKDVRLEKEFRVIWYGKPVYLYEFDLAWRPLKSILSAAQWDTVDDLSSADKQKWFDNFWKVRDPTPESPLNEIQFEFYRRVDLANVRYGLRFKEGWQTDRGQTLLSYGFPDSIESIRYSPTVQPSEIWYYFTLQKKLTFIDIDRDENYKLTGIEAIEEEKNE